MRTVIVATVIAAALLIAACGSDSTLTDAELVWCSDFDNNYDAVDSAARLLEVKSALDLSWEEAGLDLKGRRVEDIPEEEVTDEMIAAAERQEEEYPTIEAYWVHYLGTEDGTRACKAAYESR